jgi:hypothetical protein
MSEPVVDLLERGPRLRRAVVSLIVAAAVTALVATLCETLARDAIHSSPWRIGSRARALEFVATMAGFAGSFAYFLTSYLLRRRDERRARLPAPAIARERART